MEPLTESIAWHASRVQLELARRGTSIGENDTWIAGCALFFDEPLISRDTKFQGFSAGGTGRACSPYSLTTALGKVYLLFMKDTYSIKELQRETAAAVRAAEDGTLITITRHDRPVVHVLSAERLSGILEAMELLADPGFMRQLKRLGTAKLKFYPASSLAD